MKLKLSNLFCFLFLGLSIMAQEQSIQLNVPASLYSSQNVSTSSNKIVYNVSELLSSCISVYGSNPGQMAVDMADGRTDMQPGNSAFVLSTCKLYRVSGNEGQKRYNFGQSCGEENADDSNLRIVYAGAPASSANTYGDSTAVYLPVSQSQILNVTNNNTPSGDTGQQVYLRVSADQTNTATISMNYDPRQGQVYVCLYSANSGNLISMLHSKSNDLSFTVGEDVYVVPMIGPKANFDGRRTTVLFEVGDPRRNGKVVAEEESE